MATQDQTLRGKKVVLVGGGSGGHVTPLIAVGQLLQQRGAQLILIGDQVVHGWASKAAQQLTIPFYPVVSGKLHRYPTLQTLATPFRLMQGYLQARRILEDFNPDIIFSKGGYVSVPVLTAAYRQKIPIVIHESDAVMGWSNLWASRFAEKICVSFAPDMLPLAIRDRARLTGVPVCQEFYQYLKHPRPRGKAVRPVVLVTGGSQGAQGLNTLVAMAAPNLLPFADIIHLTGQADYARVQRNAQKGYRIQAIAENMETMAGFVAQADIVIGRSGATTLAEIALLGRPAILVPLPNSANNHALINAQAWERAQAALIFEQSDITPEKLVQAVHDLLVDRLRLRAMGQASRSLSVPDAAERLVRVITESIED